LSASLTALLSNLIDYAGLYPPAALSFSDTVHRYNSYLVSEHSWMLNRLVLPSTRQIDANWRVTLLVDAEPGELPSNIETLETKLPRNFSLPTYCEVPVHMLPHGAFAKLRTGGLSPDSIPPSDAIADFLLSAAERRVPFKATAGLHHPIRSLRRLTYAPEAPQAVMHGFVNVFTAAAFAWFGKERELLLDILNDVDSHAFTFSEQELRWRGQSLPTEDVITARRDFAHSFGSCSFEEPVADLRELGWLP
jgi:hypothetical protein